MRTVDEAPQCAGGRSARRLPNTPNRCQRRAKAVCKGVARVVRSCPTYAIDGKGGLMRRIGTAVIAIVIGAAVLAPAAGATSHVKVFEAKRVLCGISDGDVLCSAPGIPRPKGLKYDFGAASVILARTGTPRLVDVSDDPYEMAPVKLSPGSTWSGAGVKCKIADPLVTCKNASGRGFTIGGGKYKSF